MTPQKNFPLPLAYVAFTGIIGLGAFAYWLNEAGFSKAFEVFIAILVVSCPCALVIASPLVSKFVLSNSALKGVMIKTRFVLERLLSIKTIFFDKTGTLTEKQASVVWHNGIDEEFNKILQTLVWKSEHPICKSLRKPLKELVQFKRIEEVAGKGIIAETDQGVQVFLGQSESATVLQVNGQTVAVIQAEENLKPETFQIIQQLQKRYQLVLLSGDQSKLVKDIAEKLMMSQYYSETSPEEKKLLVQKSPHSLMIGDGINDAPAMKTASVAVAVESGLWQTKDAASVFLTNGGLWPLWDLFQSARQYQRLLNLSYAFSFVYNAIGISLAAAGVLAPIVCAVLMPLSSLSIVGIAYFGTKEKRWI